MKKALSFYNDNRRFFNIVILCMMFFAHCFWGNMMYIVYLALLLMVLFDNVDNGMVYIVFALPFCSLNVFISVILYSVCATAFYIRFLILNRKEKIKDKYPCFSNQCDNDKNNEENNLNKNNSLSTVSDKENKDKECLKQVVKKKISPLNKTLLILISIFALYCILPIGKYNSNFALHFGLLAITMLFIYILSSYSRKLDFLLCFRVFTFAVIIAGVMSLTYFVSPYLQSYFALTYAGSFPRFMALFIHTNVLAMSSELILAIYTALIIKKKIKKLDVLFFLIISIYGILTFSKTFLLIFCALLLILFIYALKTKWKTTLIVTGFVVAVLAVVFAIKPTYFLTMIDRFLGELTKKSSFAEIMNTLTTGRYDLWVEYVKYLFANPLALFFGRGLGAPVLPDRLSPHNMFITMIYELGLVGTALLISIVIIFTISKFKSKNLKFSFTIFIPVAVVLLLLLEEDLIFFIIC